MQKHTHTHTERHTHTDSDEYSIVVFCKNATIKFMNWVKSNNFRISLLTCHCDEPQSVSMTTESKIAMKLKPKLFNEQVPVLFLSK